MCAAGMDSGVPGCQSARGLRRRPKASLDAVRREESAFDFHRRMYFLAVSHH